MASTSHDTVTKLINSMIQKDEVLWTNREGTAGVVPTNMVPYSMYEDFWDTLYYVRF